MAFATETAAATCNTGIVDLGDRTLVFDTFLTPKAGSDLRRAAEILTGRPVAYVVNSHYHNDHIRGTQEFPGTVVISTDRTRNLIATKEVEEIRSDTDLAPQRLLEWQEQLRAAVDPGEQRQLRYWVEYARVIVESLPSLRLVLPQLTFERKLVIRGPARRVELVALAGHTPDDVIMLLPQDGIAFLGDLLFVGFHPSLIDGNPDDWLQSLNTIERQDVTTLVPGHGPLGTMDDIGRMRDYIAAVDETAQDLARRGAVPDATLLVPEAFRSWGYGRFFPTNVKFVWERLTAGGR
ncbi:MAG TPA: MBL fold metallo-hydrolase [bacterium]|nr:MBL fold metallo-hydrolase [bacterium]